MKWVVGHSLRLTKASRLGSRMKNISVTTSCVFFILLSMFHVLQAQSDELSLLTLSSKKAQSAATIKADAQRLKIAVKRISKSVKIKENQRTKLQKKIFFFDKKIQEQGLALQALFDKKAKTQARLDELEQEKSTLAVDIASANQSMVQLIRAFHLMGTESPTKSLINGDSISNSGRMKVYHQYLVKEYLSQYQTLKKNSEAFDSLNKTLNAELAVFEKLSKKNRRQTAKLQSSYTQRNTSLAKLVAEIKSQNAKVKLLKNDQKRLEKLAKAIAKLKLSRSSGMSFAKHKGGLSWPVEGRLVNKFGRTRAGSRLKWNGVLIETRAGADVFSVASGRVVFSDWLSGYGFLLIVEHGRGYMSLYGHNQQLLVNVGDHVQKKQKISLAGSSGRNGKPALYFEIRRKGKPVNPAKWLSARKLRK